MEHPGVVNMAFTPVYQGLIKGSGSVERTIIKKSERYTVP